MLVAASARADLTASYDGSLTMHRKQPAKDAYDDALLVRREDDNDAAKDETAAIYGEALELVAYIVANDRPFTEIGTADYTVANALFQSDPNRMPYPMEPVVGMGYVVRTDLALLDGSRRLLHGVTGAENPNVDDPALRGAVVALVRRLYGQRVAANDPEVDGWVALYRALWTDTSESGTGYESVPGTRAERAWRGLLTAMLRSPRMLLSGADGPRGVHGARLSRRLLRRRLLQISPTAVPASAWRRA